MANLTKTIAEYNADTPPPYGAGDTVTIADTAVNILTIADFSEFATNNVDILNATDNALSLTVTQYLALGSVSLTPADVVTLADTGANIAGLSAGQIGLLGVNGVDIIDASTALTLTFQQYQALDTVALTSGDSVTVTLTSAEFNALAAADFTEFGADFVDVLDIDGGTNSAVSISSVKAAALVGTAGLSIATGDTVTLSDTGAAIAARSAAEIGLLAARGVDTINSSTDALTLTLAQYQALQPTTTTLTAADIVTVTMTGAEFDAGLPGDFTDADAKLIDIVDVDGGTNASVTIDAAAAAELVATSGLSIASGDVVTLTDTGVAIAALSDVQIAALDNHGVDAINAGDDTLTLTLAQYQALGTVTLTAADAVTVSMTASEFNALSASDFTAFAAANVDVLDVTPGALSVSITAAKAIALVATSGLSVASGDTVTLSDTGAAIAALNTTQLGALAGRGVDIIDATGDLLSLTAAQASALAPTALTFTAGDAVTIVDTGAAIAGITATNVGLLATQGVDVVNASDNVLSLTVAQYNNLGTIALTPADVVTLADTGAAIAALSDAAIGLLGVNGIDSIDASTALTLTYEQYLALGSVTLTSADSVTVTLSSAQFGALTAGDFTTFGTKLVDVLDVDGGTNSSVSMSAAQAATLVAQSGLSIAAGDIVTLTDSAVNIQALTSTQIGALAGHGVDNIDSTDNVLSLTVAKATALGAVVIAPTDVVTLADTGANIAALSTVQITALGGNGIDIIDASTALTLSLQQYQSLGTVVLTAADTVTVTVTSSEFAALTPSDFTAFGTNLVDVIDVNGSGTNSAVSVTAAKAAALVAQTGLTIASGDIVTLFDTGAAIAALTPTQIDGLDAHGVDFIDASDGTLTLTKEQYDVLGTVTLTSGDAVTVTLSSGQFSGLAAADFTTFGTKLVDVLDVDGTASVSIDASRAAALVATSGLSIATGDTVTLADSSTNILALTSTQIGFLGARGVDIIDTTDNILTLTYAQYLSLGTVVLAAGDAVTVTLSSAQFAGLTAGDFTTFGAKFVDTIDVDGGTNSSVTISAAQAITLVAQSNLSIASGDTVTLTDTGAAIAALNTTQIAALFGHGVDVINSTDNVLSLTVAQYQALIGTPTTLTGADTVTLADTGANIAALTAVQVGDLNGDGIDVINATDNALTLAYDQYSALGSVVLTSADTVTVNLSVGEFGALVNADFATLEADFVDVLDINGGTNSALSLNASKAAALIATSGLTFASGDTITVADTGANISALSAAQIAALSARGVDGFDASDNVVSLTVAQALALGSLTFALGDAVTISGTAAAISALSVSQINTLAGHNIDFADTSDTTEISLSQEQQDAFTAAGITFPNDDINTGPALTAPTISSIPENTSGGLIDGTEAANGTTVIVNLTGTNAIAGDTLTIEWGPTEIVQYTLLTADITGNSATVTVPFSTIDDEGDGTFNVTAFLSNGTDSPDSAAVSVTVNTAGHVITGTAAADTIDATHVPIGQTVPTDGVDIISGLGGNDKINALGGNDQIFGGADADSLTGGDGDDLLDGGTGVDKLIGGLGNDTYVVDEVKEKVTEAAGLGSGTDLVQASVNYTLGSNVEDLTLTGSALLGTGNTLDNHIIGNASDNTLVGGLGNDILDGSSGNDTVSYAASKAAVNVNLLTNTATGGDAQGDTFFNIDNLIGTKLGDTLTGDGNDNILTGGLGNDILTGGNGNDTFIIASKGDGIDTISGGGGSNDTIQITGTTAIVFAGFDAAALSIENFVGNGLQILGTAGNDTFDLTGLTSGTGVTFLDGGAGNDTLIDNDTFGSELRGGAGNDTLTGGASDNLLIGGAGADTLNGGGGNDTADYSASKAGVTISLDLGTATGGDATGDTLTSIENLVGTAKIDYFEGNGSDNILDGGKGVDTVSYEHASGAVTVDLDAGTVTGWGNDTLMNFENIVGSDFNDTLTGNALGNIIIGGEGNDTITSGAGKDVLWVNGDGLTNGDDTVTDFVVGQDKLSLDSDFFDKTNIPTLTQDGSDVVMTFGIGNTITFEDHVVADFSSKDVLFH